MFYPPAPQVVLHPHFQNQTDWDNDLALIKLKEPVLISEKVTPIPLPEKGQDLADVPNGKGVIAGWGWGLYLELASPLRHLLIPLVNHSACKAEYDTLSYTPFVDDNMFCTGSAKWGGNVCFGDAGGALAVIDAETGDIYAAGILSYDKCCTSQLYAVHMKISSYLPWIHKVTRGDTEKSFAVRSQAMSTLFSWQIGN